MSDTPNVFLVGPMGAGKSSIGRHLAQLLKYDFWDSDHEIEFRTGADIPWIFDVEGEEGFRSREESIIDELTRMPRIVLATGGGAVTRPANRERLQQRGVVVFLKTSVDEQLARTSRDRNRPLLQTPDPRQRLTDLLSQRLPLYEKVADIVVETDQRRIKDVAKEIAAQVKSFSK